MTFILRVAGTVGAAVLASTGVGIPLAVGIGAVVSGVGNGVADTIEKNQAESKANAEAARLKKESEDRLAEQQRRAAEEAQRAQAQLNANRRQAELPGFVLDHCRNNTLDAIPALLREMNEDRFNQLGLTPLAECFSADAQERVAGMLHAERARRGL